jgi:hypothetical protein
MPAYLFLCPSRKIGGYSLSLQLYDSGADRLPERDGRRLFNGAFFPTVEDFFNTFNP